MKHQFTKYIAAGLSLLLTAALWGCGKEERSEADAGENSSITDSLPDESSAQDTEGSGTPSADESSAADPSSAANPETSGGTAGESSDAGAETPDAPEQSTPDAPEQSGGNAQAEASYDVGSAPTVGIGAVTVKQGTREAAVPLSFWNNPGFTTCGIRIEYDPVLEPKIGDDGLAVHDPGEASLGLMTACVVGTDYHALAFGTVGMSNCTKSGVLGTVYFTLPEDAAAGTVYKFLIEIDSMIDQESKPVNAEVIGGEIRITE